MKRPQPPLSRLYATIGLIVCLLAAMPAQGAITFTWLDVGDAGNGDDPATGYGGVDYDYQISAHEVTNAQYAQFLNSIAATSGDPNGVWNANMDISRAGSGTLVDPYVYTVDIGFDDHPINQASFFDAMRFVNWVENGCPTGAQDASTTETGTYTISDGTSEIRTAGAAIALATEDEWYKAAYYDGAGGYNDYPTQSDTAPTAGGPPGGSNSANYNNAHGDTTIVGSYTSTTSHYGAFDLGGNVFEWTEGLEGTTKRVVRGGSYTSSASTLASTGRTGLLPGGGSFEGGVGFRLVMIAIPEPSSAFLLITGAMAMLIRRKRG